MRERERERERRRERCGEKKRKRRREIEMLQHIHADILSETCGQTTNRNSIPWHF